MSHMRGKHSGEPKAQTKWKELVLYQALQKAGVVFEYQRHIPFKACDLDSERTCAYVDFVIPRPWGYVVLECDEDQHRKRPPECDARRDFDIAESVARGSNDALMVVRYNPDKHRVDGIVRAPGHEHRMKRLLETINHTPAAFERLFLFYDHASSSTLPQVAAAWDPAACQASRVVE